MSGATQIRAARASREALSALPTAARRKVDGRDVALPEGYTIEPVLVGLSFPTALDQAEDGTLYVCEGGSTWPTRPYMPARILAIHPSGDVDVIAEETLGGPRGISCRNGSLYVSVKGGYFSRIVRYDLRRRDKTILVDKLPDGGWHEPGGPVFGPDGLMYFGQGSVGLNGVVETAGFTVDVAKHPEAHDVPGQDVTLTGNNVWSRNPTTAFPYLAETGPFKPFGTPARKGEVIKGELHCSTGIWRARPDGSEMELLAWGVRNPFGMAIDERGELYVSDNDFEEKGDRPIGADPDRVWHIRNARTPHGAVKTPDWYGFPDYCGDGLPVWHEQHRPQRGPEPEPLLENPPPLAGPAVYLERAHSCMTKMDFCRSDEFGHRGELFLCQWGTLAPLNSLRPEDQGNGFKVIRIDVGAGRAETFVQNRKPGPASADPGSGGIERPVDCKFGRDGRTLYLLDFGYVTVTKTHMVAYAHTGVLWRITRR
jgi:hypothetical protein